MNIALAIIQIHPQAIPMVDFVIQDDSDGEGAYIAIWNLEVDPPTDEELQVAWEAYLLLPEVPIPETDAEKIARLEAEKEALTARVDVAESRVDAAETRVGATEDSIVMLMDTILSLMIPE